MAKTGIEDNLRKRIETLENMLLAKLDKERKGKKLHDIAAQLGFEVGCGDNSCMWGPPGGMGTNGGCRCIERPSYPTPTNEEYALLKEEFRKLKLVAQELLRTLVALE